MRVTFVLAYVCISAAALSACATFPQTAAIQKFSGATKTAAQLLQGAAKLDLDLAEKEGYEQAVTDYITNQPFDFPPTGFALLQKKRIAARLQVLDAIASYATALAAVNDPQQPAKVATAVSGLSTAVSNFAKAAEPTAKTSQIAPVGNIFAAFAGFYVSQRNAMAVHDAIVAANPLIKQAASLLGNDFSILARRFKRRLRELRALQKQKLIYIRGKQNAEHANSQSSTMIDLENKFFEQYSEGQALSTQVAALEQSSKILNALVKAHDALAKSRDTDRAISEFKTLVDAIATNVKQIKQAH